MVLTRSGRVRLITADRTGSPVVLFTVEETLAGAEDCWIANTPSPLVPV